MARAPRRPPLGRYRWLHKATGAPTEVNVTYWFLSREGWIGCFYTDPDNPVGSSWNVPKEDLERL